MTPRARVLDVFLGDVHVGALTEISNGAAAFRTSERYRDLVDRPVLGQNFEDDLERDYVGRRGLPAFFANLVPEGKLRRVLEEALDIEPEDDFGLLEAVGADLPGCLVLRRSVDGAEYEAPKSDETEATLQEDAGLRFSVAGVQLKFSMLLSGDRMTLPAADRRGHWLVKLAPPKFAGVVENESAMLDWARVTGFDVCEHRIVRTNQLEGLPAGVVESDEPALAVRRYDRTDDGCVHQEDFAQVAALRPSLKYDQITQEKLLVLVKAICGVDGLEEGLRRLAFVLGSGNADAHLKNWSLVYPNRMRAALSPLYDQVATVAWPEHSRQLALKLCGRRDFGAVTSELVRELARRVDHPSVRVEEIFEETLQSMREGFAQVRSSLPGEHVDSLREHWSRVPLLRDHGDLT